MPSLLLTCPESAHLEKIDYDEHPLGMLVRGCSRFSPPCAVDCPRTCAARIDQRNRLREAARSLEIGDDTSVQIILDSLGH